MSQQRYRVVQWTTGNVGKETALAIIDNPYLELVGCYAWGEEKQGVDVGELLGRSALGIIATRDIASLLALKPDCVCYNPLWGDADQLCQILTAGINVATSSHFITGSRSYGAADRKKIEQACERGGSSIFGSGMHPGFSNMLALATTSACNRVDKITILESQDASGYASAETQRSVGFDHPIEADYLEEMAKSGSEVFAEGIELMAKTLKVELDEITFKANFAPATADNDLGFMMLPEEYRDSEETKLGSTVTLSSELVGDQHWQGRIVRTEGAIDTNSHQLYVVAQIDDPYQATNTQMAPIKIGQYVKAEIVGKSVKQALVIPNSAIYQGSYVYIAKQVEEKTVLLRKDITIRWQNNQDSLISAGLAFGEELVLTPLGQVSSGTQVKVARASSSKSKRNSKTGEGQKKKSTKKLSQNGKVAQLNQADMAEAS